MRNKLHCGHVKEVRNGQTRVWCGWCGKFEVVANEGWAFKCDNCRYSRVVGMAPLTAKTLATSHALRLNHRVRLYLDQAFMEVIEPKGQTRLDNEPPF